MTNNHDDWFKNNSQPNPAPEKPSRPRRSFSFKGAFKKKNSNSEPETKVKREPETAFGKAAHKAGQPFAKGFHKVAKGSYNLITKAKAKPLLTRILYTLLLILIFRIAATITVPGVVVPEKYASDSSSFLGIMDMMGGGALRNFSIVALGISPYITASIIMQLLQSEAFPAINRLSRSGPAGKRKINVITRSITLVFAIMQAIVMIQQFSSHQMQAIQLTSAFDKPTFKYVVLPMILIGGSMFTLFLGEQITNRGVGNGTSLIIFSGIVAGMPNQFRYAWQEIVGGASANSAFVGIMNFTIYTAVFLLLIFIIAYLYKAERHVPIQQTGSGMTTDIKQMSRLPIKINPAGVLPVIFPMMIMSLPLQVAQFLDHQSDVRQWIETNLTFTAPIGLSVTIALIFFFSIAMSIVTFNPATIAENFKKNGTFIPGVRPGEETEKYLTGIVIRLSIFSGFYLSVITAVKYIQEIMGLSSIIAYGGTSLIIVVTVAIETLQQLKARETTQKITQAKIKTVSSDGDATGGLLW